MGQSATLYRISKSDFEDHKSDQQKLISLSKEFVTFDQTFLGLDFVLKKGEDYSSQKNIGEIFNPRSFESNGAEFDFDSLSDDEIDGLFLEEGLFGFLPADKVSVINSILEKLTIKEVSARFDPEELNENDIYPGSWHSDNSPEQSFNLRQILEDFELLKNLFYQASKEDEYILQFIG